MVLAVQFKEKYRISSEWQVFLNAGTRFPSFLLSWTPFSQGEWTTDKPGKT